MSMSNDDRNAHGGSAQESLNAILNRYVTNKYLAQVVNNYSCGKDGYSDKKQFKAPFLIEFQDGEQWIIFSTTSLRDRFKCQLWDAEHIKEVIPSARAYLVYPDGIADNEKAKFISKKNIVNSGKGYYTVDDIISQNELINLIEIKATSAKSSGSQSGVLGNAFEDRVAYLLSYSANLKKWQTDSATIEGMHYDLFKTIVECFELPKGEIDSISADTKIGKIPSKLSKYGKPLGKAKADVKVSIKYSNGDEKIYTISCKRSNADNVSVHDYTAEQFSYVLDSSNHELHDLLVEFQRTGTLSGFGKENGSKLTASLKPYHKKLILWVLGGIDGYGDASTQWANYILTYDTNDQSFAMHRLMEYYQLLIDQYKTQHFGTPFQWTYPSGEQGDRINLKCPIIK